MKEKSKVSFLGGDITTLEVLKILASEGHGIMTYALEDITENFEKENVTQAESLDELINYSEIIISSTSFIDSMGNLLTAFSKNKIPFSEIEDKIENKTIVTGGVSKEEITALTKKGNEVLDINEMPEIKVLNALTAAEGALEIAISQTNYTINGSKILVIGYGKLGKSISKIFKALGAKVSVEARKPLDLAWIKSNGYNPVHINDLSKAVPDAQIIINTVPVSLLKDEDYAKIQKDALIIDLTYNPSGIDKSKSNKYGIRNVWPLALLSKIGSQSYSKTIREILKNKYDI